MKVGDHVIVETARGVEFGRVVLGPKDVEAVSYTHLTGQTESGRPFHGVQKGWKIYSGTSGSRKELSYCSESGRRNTVEVFPELVYGKA